MATLTIHNIFDDLLKKLQRSARENGRAVDKEAIMWLSRVEVPDTPEIQSTEEMLKNFRELRNRYPDSYVTDEEITRAKHAVPPPLEDEVGEPSQQPDPWLERARALRESMPDVYIGDNEELNRFKREGRL